jgi:hypothetical protein
VVPSGSRLTLAIPANASQKVYFTLNGVDPRLPGGKLHSLAREFKEPILLQGKTRVAARTRDARGNWGPLWLGVYVVNAR